MTIRLPHLDLRRNYKRSELVHFLLEADFDQVTLGFPKDIERWPNENLLLWRPGEEVFFEYTEMDIGEFLSQIEEFERVFRTKEDETNRVLKIKRLLETGDTAFPLFIQKNDPRKRIVEGMHRSVAMMELSMPRLPVLLSKYADW